MPSIKQILAVAAVGIATVTAIPTRWQESAILSKRQNPATGLPDGLTDIDVLQL